MIAARNEASGSVPVELLTTQFEEDAEFVPEGFRATPNLTRSIQDLGEFESDRKLPLLRDILGRLHANSDAPWLIYTNVDIALQKDFYLRVAELSERSDAFAINRRTIDASFTSPDQLHEMYQDSGKPHAGFDCFVLRRDLVPKLLLDDVVIGMPTLGRALLVNLRVHGDRFSIYRRQQLTFHIGDPRTNTAPHLADMRRHNRNAYARIWRQLRRGRPELEAWRPKYPASIKGMARSVEKSIGGLCREVLSDRAFSVVKTTYRSVRRPGIIDAAVYAD